MAGCGSWKNNHEITQRIMRRRQRLLTRALLRCCNRGTIDEKKEVKIRLTEGELARLNDNVAKTGLSRETYLRLLISHRVPVELPPADYRALMRQLRQIQFCLTNAPAQPENGTDPFALQNTLQALDHTLLAMQHAVLPRQAIPVESEASNNA